MKSEIQKFFKGEVEDGEETLAKYSHDASLLEVRPQMVLFPKDSDDVKNLVKWVNENKQNKEKYPNLSITARCAGTDMSGGAIGESIILDFTRYMNKLVRGPEIVKNSSGLTLPGIPGGTHTVQNSLQSLAQITVQPGMFYRDFEKITLEKGLLLPCYTASKSINAMGGMVANNSGGEKTLVYGKTEEYVEQLKVVLTDGNEYTINTLTLEELNKKIAENTFESKIYENIYNLIKQNEEEIKNAKPKVSKNSAGYYIWNVVGGLPMKNFSGLTLPGVPGGTHTVQNSLQASCFDLNKLLVGSQGTLGIITEITFRLVKPKPYSKLLVVFLRDMKILPDLVNRILKHQPETLESYDDKTFFLVLKYIVSFAKLLGLQNFFRLILSFWPEALMTIRHGFPKLILLVEFTANSQLEADKMAKDALGEIKTISKIGTHIAKNAFEAKKYWTIRHEAFNLIRYHLKKQKSEPFIDDVIVRPEKLPEFFPALYSILAEYKDKMTFAIGGHSGDGNMHIYTLMNPKDPALKEIVTKVSERVYDLVIRLGGSITAEHNDGLIRTPYLEKMYGAKIMAIFTEIKNIFDPKNIFNPGKKIALPGGAGTKEYVSSHIAIEQK